MKYLFCYDIANPKRMHKISCFLEKKGIRIQKSFFFCDMKKTEMTKTRKKLESFMDIKKDSLLIYKICEKCSSQAILDGSGPYIDSKSYVII